MSCGRGFMLHICCFSAGRCLIYATRFAGCGWGAAPGLAMVCTRAESQSHYSSAYMGGWASITSEMV